MIANAARALWANKVAAELAARTGCSLRTAEGHLAGRPMKGDALANLLASDEGPHFLEAMISTLPPSRQRRWRKEFERAAVRAELRERLEKITDE